MSYRIANAHAFARLAFATFLAYLRFVNLVVAERLWRLPPRRRRLAGVAVAGGIEDAS